MFAASDEEVAPVCKWLLNRVNADDYLHEIAIFVQSNAQSDHATAAARRAKVPFKVLDESVEAKSGDAAICAMHLAKGLEFQRLAVMACDDDAIPLQERAASIGDEAD